MTKRIITISREFGSGGRFIGEEVAKKLGIKYYDKEIIGQIAKESGLAPEYIKENAELSPKKGIFAYAFTGLILFFRAPNPDSSAIPTTTATIMAPYVCIISFIYSLPVI